MNRKAVMFNLPDLVSRRAELVKLMHRLETLDNDHPVTAGQTIASLRCLIDQLDDYILTGGITLVR